MSATMTTIASIAPAVLMAAEENVWILAVNLREHKVTCKSSTSSPAQTLRLRGGQLDKIKLGRNLTNKYNKKYIKIW